MKTIVSAIIMSLLILHTLPSVSAGVDRKKVYYRIHEASYKKPVTAATEVKALNAKGYSAYYKKVNIPGKGIWYRVYIGQYENRENAVKAAQEMREKHAIDYAAIERSDSSSRRDLTPVPESQKEPITAAIPTSDKNKNEKKSTAGQSSRNPLMRAGRSKAAALVVDAKKKDDVSVLPKQESGAAKIPASPAATSVQQAKPSPPVEPPTSVPCLTQPWKISRANAMKAHLPT